MCLDLVGPVNQDSHTHDNYILVMIDPFTHFVRLELVNVQCAPTIAKAFVQRILCEEGQPRYMLTDSV